ncbi:hypothetical protein L2E82_06672 [Cichorium intybus]|uniref:Uncharacterized protein n=1 Tax=Cichorium intybus TaxID=13427 RepID=A0ACB9HBR6_CICIN|nr:hypothetical protein L2E82_06672 [Cichorium intybus]
MPSLVSSVNVKGESQFRFGFKTEWKSDMKGVLPSSRVVRCQHATTVAIDSLKQRMLSAQTTYSCSISEDSCQKRKQIRSEAAN